MVEAIGVPFDLCGQRMGSRLGPAALRLAGLEDAFDELHVDFKWGGEIQGSEELLERSQSLTNIEPLIQCVTDLRKRTTESLQTGHTPLVIGGDHAIAAGSIGAALNYLSEDMALLWIDAHADINTPGTSTSGNVHGMPVAALLGMQSEVTDERDGMWRTLLEALGPARLRMEHLAWCGLRSVDPPEKKLIRSNPACMATTMYDVDRYGLIWELRRFDVWMRSHGAKHLWISFDVDAMDPILAPGTGTTVTGGFSYREAHLIAEVLCEFLRAENCPYKLAGLDVVEINPLFDRNNETAKMAVQWIGSLFGKSIL
ncbi:MAG TPA: arginase family protein [Fimbriimonadaceae bacterium]|nr:arginase family protein [Fimbriimonadaceae bacterium]